MAHGINGGVRMMDIASLQQACEQLEAACNAERGWQEIECLANQG
ncbi:TPA: hypothetical protein I4E15_19845 [Enterobacter asburiae]|nr:hypothetical protein [Enterobacter asburiae]HAS1956983.1 hypothetical protein [Enterobacter asburiae]HAS1966752.1 hypothetical protein [Enterobacter asburiae]HCU0702865.1 Hpt domain-containing protein [Enterobacter asburiae]